jgi:hypothetical protein
MRMVAKERIANEGEKGEKRVGQNSRGGLGCGTSTKTPVAGKYTFAYGSEVRK